MRISGCDVRISIVRPARDRRGVPLRPECSAAILRWDGSVLRRPSRPLLRAECRPPVSLPEELRGHREGCRRRPACQMRHGELSVVVQVEQDGQRRQLIVAGGQLHDDAVGLHAALPDALPEAVAVCAERLAAVGVVGQQRFGRFEDGRQRFGPPVRPCGEDSRHGGAGVGEAYLPSAGAARV